MTHDQHDGSNDTLAQPTFALIRRLQSSRQARDRAELHFIEGVRNFVTAVDMGAEFEQLIVSKRLLQSTVAQKLVRRVRSRGVPAFTVSPEQFRAVSRSARASGVAAVVKTCWTPLQSMTGNEVGRLWVAIESVRAPGNLGTLIRSCAAASATGLILLGNRADPFDPVVVRASMGATFRQRFVRTSAQRLRQWCDRHGCDVVGVTPDGDEVYHDAAYESPTVLMLGDERKGLSDEQRAVCNRTVRIPMAAGCDSINLGVAGSLLLFEASRG